MSAFFQPSPPIAGALAAGVDHGGAVLLGTEVRLDESLSAAASWRIQLLGNKVISAAGGDSRTTRPDTVVVIPVLELAATALSPSSRPHESLHVPKVEITLHALNAQRRLSVVPRECKPQDRPELAEWHCVALCVRELLDDPVLTLTLITPPQAVAAHDGLGSGFRPVAKVRFPIQGKAAEQRIRVLLHDDAHADAVSFRVRLDATPQRMSVESREASESIGAYGVAFYHLAAGIGRVLARVSSLLALPADVFCGDEARKQLTALEQQLRRWTEQHHTSDFAFSLHETRPPDDIYREAAAEHDRLFDALAAVPGFAVVLRRAVDGSVELDRYLREFLVVESLEIAYSEESKATLRRPVYLLFFLSAVLAVLAVRLSLAVDISAARIELLSRKDAQSSFATSREPLVAMLLFLPTALYADVLRTRPHGAARRKALFSYTGFLTAGFAAPLIAAIMAIGYASAYQVSVVLGAIAVVGGALVVCGWLWSRPAALRNARLKALRTGVSR